MPLRIDRIFLERREPLESDLDIEARALNLIYGRNEAGKTLLTEFVIRCLFSGGSGWKTRMDWSPGSRSRIVLSGLGDEPVPFKCGTRPWLEDFLSGTETALYPEICRLMIVSGGDATLEDGRDPADRGSIARVLSRERLLDAIRGRIEGKNDRKARIVEGKILKGGSGRGRLQEGRANAEADLLRIDSLMERAREALTGSMRADLTQRISEADRTCIAMEKARDHHAWVLEERVRELGRDLDDLATTEEVNDALSDMNIYEQTLEDLSEKLELTEELRKSQYDLSWLKNLSLFDKDLPVMAGFSSSVIQSALMYVGFALSAVLFLLDLALPGVISLLLAVAAVFVRVRSLQNLVQDRKLREEDVEEIRREFRERFSMDMPDPVTLLTMIDDLEKITGKLDILESQIVPLLRRSEELQVKTDRLLTYVQQESGGADRIARLRDILQRRKGIEREREVLRLELAPLGTAARSPESSDLEWNRDRYDKKNSDLADLKQELRSIDETSDTLAKEMSAEVGNADLNRLEDLMQALIEKRERTASEYRNLTAEIVAKILVFEVIEDQSKGEDEALRRGMQSGAVARNLHLLTGYSSIDIDENGGLLLGTNDGAEPFALRELSTGTIEQVLLSLRMGLLVDILKEPAFLILDDAFQHSDWLRRERLVGIILDIVDRGWQIVCLTMDDHVRDIIRKAAAERLPESGFLFLEL